MPSPTSPTPKHIQRLLAMTCIGLAVTAHAQAVDEDAWRFSAGVGVISQPKYPGSSETRVGALPTFSASHGRWQIGALPGAGVPVGVNYTLMQDGPWRLGVGVGTGLGNPRNAKDNNSFSKLGSIEQTTLGSLSGSYTEGALAANASIVSDVGGNGQGTRAMLDVMYRTRPTDRLSLSVGPGLTWIDSRYASTYYGVSDTQSANTGYAAYKAGAGVSALRLSAGADYQLTRDWSLSAKLGLTQLQGDAASSPTVDKKNQTSYGLFANYRF
jgi:MipA family protein